VQSRPLALALATTAAFALALLASAGVSGQAPPPKAASIAPADADPMAALADAERAFARETAKVGIRAGFLAWFAHDAIGFHPALGNAWDQINARPAPPNPTAVLLEWEPRVGDVAASGELGWLTGPSTFTAPDGSKHYGNYLSVWTRKPEGWRVFIDVGADAPQPVPFAPGFTRFPFGARYARTEDPAASAASLLSADRALNARIAAAGAATAYAEVTTDASRFHRRGFLPSIGRSAAEKWTAQNASCCLGGT